MRYCISRAAASDLEKVKREMSASLLFVVIVLMALSGCATAPSAQLPEPPPAYVYEYEEESPRGTANSLWNENGNIFEDRKARRLNDIVTINVIESLSGSGKADTNTSRESTADFGLESMLGMSTDFNLHKAPLIKSLYQGGDSFSPEVKGSATSDFKGTGDTNREGSLIATLTARVIEVLPNGNLVISGRKELTINDERQILVLTGTVRPDDISSHNIVLSTSLADAKVYYVGDGVIQDKQKPGWATRAFDKIWPF